MQHIVGHPTYVWSQGLDSGNHITYEPYRVVVCLVQSKPGDLGWHLGLTQAVDPLAQQSCLAKARRSRDQSQAVVRP